MQVYLSESVGVPISLWWRAARRRTFPQPLGPLAAHRQRLPGTHTFADAAGPSQQREVFYSRVILMNFGRWFLCSWSFFAPRLISRFSPRVALRPFLPVRFARTVGLRLANRGCRVLDIRHYL